MAIARTHRHLGQIEMADQVAGAALAEATEADDDWAVGWALHVLTYHRRDAGPDQRTRCPCTTGPWRSPRPNLR